MNTAHFWLLLGLALLSAGSFGLGWSVARLKALGR